MIQKRVSLYMSTESTLSSSVETINNGYPCICGTLGVYRHTDATCFHVKGKTGLRHIFVNSITCLCIRGSECETMKILDKSEAKATHPEWPCFQAQSWPARRDLQQIPCHQTLDIMSIAVKVPSIFFVCQSSNMQRWEVEYPPAQNTPSSHDSPELTMFLQVLAYLKEKSLASVAALRLAARGWISIGDWIVPVLHTPVHSGGPARSP